MKNENIFKRLIKYIFKTEPKKPVIQKATPTIQSVFTPSPVFTCQECGKSGVTLKLSENNLCPDCYNSYLRKKQREEREKQLNQQVADAINNIPIHNIKIDENAPIIKQKITDIGETKISPITRKTSKQKICDFVVIDIETTGIKLTGNKILEVSGIKYIDFEPVECFSTLINPKKDIPPEATKINNITNDMVMNCPEFHQIQNDFKEFIGNLPIIGHNIEFDIRHLFKNGLDLSNHKKIYDTMEIAKKRLKRYNEYDADKAYERDKDYDWDVDDYKLSTLCSYAGIAMGNAHRSLFDCYATANLFIYFVDNIIGEL